MSGQRDDERPLESNVPPYVPPQRDTDNAGGYTPGYPVNDAPTYPSVPPPAYTEGDGTSKAAGELPPYPAPNVAYPNQGYPMHPYSNAYPGYPAYGQNQHHVIVQQPGPVVWAAAPLENPPEDYMCYSIFVTLCCCWLMGIFAIMSSSQSRAASAVGDRVTAEMKSREALRKANLALCLGIVSIIVVGAIIGVYYGMAFSSH